MCIWAGGAGVVHRLFRDTVNLEQGSVSGGRRGSAAGSCPVVATPSMLHRGAHAGEGVSGALQGDGWSWGCEHLSTRVSCCRYSHGLVDGAWWVHALLLPSPPVLERPFQVLAPQCCHFVRMALAGLHVCWFNWSRLELPDPS